MKLSTGIYILDLFLVMLKVGLLGVFIKCSIFCLKETYNGVFNKKCLKFGRWAGGKIVTGQNAVKEGYWWLTISIIVLIIVTLMLGDIIHFFSV